MMQQVDLLADEFRKRREYLAPGQMFIAWGALVGVLLCISAWQQISTRQLADLRLTIQQEWQALADRNDSLRATLDAAPEPQLINEVETLRSLFNSQSVMVEAVRKYEQSSEGGFSGYLADLAAQHVPGLALSHIELRDGGGHILLSGEVERPVTVPKFLRRLSDGRSFKGHRFDEFRIEAQDSGLLRFDIVGPATDERS
jgi:hypothetical protein